MTETEVRRNPLVEHLEGLARREDRATLALLRGTLQAERRLDGLPVVLPFVTALDRFRDREEDDALLLAGLFALHPEPGPHSLASALRIVWQTSDSVELRFRALLSASREDLPAHLRHAVSLVAGHGIALDYRDLQAAIRFWDRSDRARRQWARAFWTPDHTGETTERSA
jgi:CRISPR system Cascade subunit CasB